MNPLFSLFEGAVMREILTDMIGHPHAGPAPYGPTPMPTEPDHGPGYPEDKNCWDPSTWGQHDEPVFTTPVEPQLIPM